MKTTQFIPLCFAITFTWFPGCHTPRVAETVVGSNYIPSNVFRAQSQLPGEMKRIAIFPIACMTDDPSTLSGADSLQPLVWSELGKTKMFECIPMTSEKLKEYVGMRSISSENVLAPDLMTKIKQNLGCDGIMFCTLTKYQPYRPISIGWNFKLVDCRESKIWWSVDEIFDSGNEAVSNAARRYYQSSIQSSSPLLDSTGILGTPTRFGQYTLSSVFSTLPMR